MKYFSWKHPHHSCTHTDLSASLVVMKTPDESKGFILSHSQSGEVKAAELEQVVMFHSYEPEESNECLCLAPFLLCIQSSSQPRDWCHPQQVDLTTSTNLIKVIQKQSSIDNLSQIYMEACLLGDSRVCQVDHQHQSSRVLTVLLGTCYWSSSRPHE